MLKNGEPRTNIRIVAAGMIKNQNFIKRYDRLDAQLANATFQLQSAATTETLVNVMKSMNEIFNMNQNNLDMKDIQKTTM